MTESAFYYHDIAPLCLNKLPMKVCRETDDAVLTERLSDDRCTLSFARDGKKKQVGLRSLIVPEGAGD